MLERVRKRTRSRSISISLELLEEIEKACNGNISVSSFLKMAAKKELEIWRRRNAVFDKKTKEVIL